MGVSFSPTITENSDACFQWKGPPLYGLIGGVHSFHFEPSEGGKGTKFTHEEVHYGPAAFLLSTWSPLIFMAGKGSFEGFNRDLKAKCEELNEG